MALNDIPQLSDRDYLRAQEKKKEKNNQSMKVRRDPDSYNDDYGGNYYSPRERNGRGHRHDDSQREQKSKQYGRSPPAMTSSQSANVIPVIQIVPIPMNFGMNNGGGGGGGGYDEFQRQYMRDQIAQQNENIQFMMNQMQRERMREVRDFTRSQFQNRINELGREFNQISEIQGLKNEIRFLNSVAQMGMSGSTGTTVSLAKTEAYSLRDIPQQNDSSMIVQSASQVPMLPRIVSNIQPSAPYYENRSSYLMDNIVPPYNPMNYMDRRDTYQDVNRSNRKEYQNRSRSKEKRKIEKLEKKLQKLAHNDKIHRKETIKNFEDDQLEYFLKKAIEEKQTKQSKTRRDSVEKEKEKGKQQDKDQDKQQKTAQQDSDEDAGQQKEDSQIVQGISPSPQKNADDSVKPGRSEIGTKGGQISDKKQFQSRISSDKPSRTRSKRNSINKGDQSQYDNQSENSEIIEQESSDAESPQRKKASNESQNDENSGSEKKSVQKKKISFERKKELRRIYLKQIRYLGFVNLLFKFHKFHQRARRKVLIDTFTERLSETEKYAKQWFLQSLIPAFKTILAKPKLDVDLTSPNAKKLKPQELQQRVNAIASLVEMILQDLILISDNQKFPKKLSIFFAEYFYYHGYPPSNYLFPFEKNRLEIHPVYGYIRSGEPDNPNEPITNGQRSSVFFLNFILIRTFIMGILLNPWDILIGPKDKLPQTPITQVKLKTVASIFHIIAIENLQKIEVVPENLRTTHPDLQIFPCKQTLAFQYDPKENIVPVDIVDENNLEMVSGLFNQEALQPFFDVQQDWLIAIDPQIFQLNKEIKDSVDFSYKQVYTRQIQKMRNTAADLKKDLPDSVLPFKMIV